MMYDLSPIIRTGVGGTAVFPGDTPPSREVLLDMTRGDNLTLSTLRTTVHLGAHADGENHYGVLDDGITPARSIDQMPLEHYLGSCQVIHAEPIVHGGHRAERVGIEHLGGVSINRRRVLICTGTWPDSSVFNEDFAGLEPALIEHLADRGVITIGVDTPSVDPASSKDLPAHAACLRRGVAIIEGLRLREVPADDVYELIALPLRLEGFDGSPVRAVLRRVV